MATAQFIRYGLKVDKALAGREYMSSSVISVSVLFCQPFVVITVALILVFDLMN